MVFQAYERTQSPDSGSGADWTDGATAIPMRCHRAMVPADLVVSTPLAVLGGVVMALLALPREVMMAGAVMTPARLRTRRHRGA